MKSTISILLTSVALTTGGYLGWREWQPNLTGHWDIVEEPLDEHYSTLAWMETLDITNDNTVYLNYSPDSPSPTIGAVNRLFRSMYIGPGCLSLNIDYHPDGNTLFLEIENPIDNSSPYRFTAVKRSKCPHSWRPEANYIR
ncbi:hypothetical protein [Neolewinella agarilytica]|uniref:Uncharacterized protein n=1 Tax=Neolewinella agarilytica TaxID=478744 RepID=A0A1H9NSG2_9BACT|nr:hypothetical protein [Neolewinella agarilytica]SER38828.1 hypothetical protein SAMN05444359_13920 [Neolewinella agarilytica]